MNALRKIGARLGAFLVLAALAGIILTGCANNQPQARIEHPTLSIPPGPALEAVCPAPQTMVAPSSPPPLAGRVVVLDAGHGGEDEGANHYGVREKDVNLDLAIRTAEMLRRQGVMVYLTRQSDAFVPLPDRSAYANKLPNAVFVSIHVNSSERNPAAYGVETFVLSSQYSDVERARTASRRYRMNGGADGNQALASLATDCRAKGPELARALQRSLCARLGEPDRGVKQKDLAVLRETYFCPAVLVEVGFVSHAGTAVKMKTPEWRHTAAEALSEGIVDFLRRVG